LTAATVADSGAELTSQELHMATVAEVLQSIKQSEMTPMLKRILQSPDGSETLDVLMKYM
jgi:actin related protein 2/3 complex subunit 5